MPIEITPVETPPERRTPTVMPQKSPVVPATPIQIPESLFRYSDITFASYDWSQDRRLPRDISTIIDAQIEQLSRSYESAAGAPSLRYATTL